MNKIMTILQSMGVEDVFGDNPVLLKNEVCVRCNSCSKEVIISAESVYRQHRRGRDKYICKSCASKKGWTSSKREIARNKSLRHWQEPDYAGEITGKALGRQIIKEVDD